jgi:glucan 1,3-beta-glucosidase
VSDHPHWLIGALAGILLAALTFGIAATAGGRKNPTPHLWPKIAGIAFPPAVMFGLAIEAVPIQSYNAGGWLRSLAFALVAAAAPIVCADACAVGRALPTFAAVLDRSGERRGGLHWALGGVFIVVVLLALQAALGLVFDPRYRDFPFAPLTAAVVPFLVLMFAVPRPGGAGGARSAAETVAGAVLIASAGYIVVNESFANWQAVWFCAAIAALGVILLRARDAPDSK